MLVFGHAVRAVWQSHGVTLSARCVHERPWCSRHMHSAAFFCNDPWIHEASRGPYFLVAFLCVHRTNLVCDSRRRGRSAKNRWRPRGNRWRPHVYFNICRRIRTCAPIFTQIRFSFLHTRVVQLWASTCVFAYIRTCACSYTFMSIR